MNSKTIPGSEFFKSDAALAARLSLTTREAVYLRVNGSLKATHEKHDGRFFATKDLDTIAARSPITSGEREKLFVDRALSELRLADRDRTGPFGRTRLQLRAVKPREGTLEGVVVLMANVPAVGKFIAVGRDGQVTDDPGKATARLPVWTDTESLDTLLSAVREAGGLVASGVDHRGGFGARLGHCFNFRRAGDTVLADIQALNASPHRAVVMEMAAKSPGLAGLSADADVDFQVEAGRAFIRFRRVRSIDFVDSGAVTRGLFTD